MRYLFIHRNAPGQYKHIIRTLAANPANEVVVVSQFNDREIPGVRRVAYTPAPQGDARPHHWLRTADEAMRFGQGALAEVKKLKASGFTPDLMVGHNAWGETLFLKDVWPDAPLLSYFEFFYAARGADTGFDPEFPASLDDYPRTRMMNTVNLLGLDAADWGHAPTFWQRDRFPALHRPRISVIHEGIDTKAIRPNPNRVLRLPDNGGDVRFGDEIITFVSRSLEPYRGFHVFMRALPEILRRRPKARVLVVGNDDVSYGARLADGRCFREALIAEQGGRIDLSRVHFLGWVPYEVHLAILQVSAVHVYLTYPFVLSWSMLEAMASGCCVVGSATPPVMEVIRDGENGLLTDFFSQKGLADRIDQALDVPGLADRLRARARQTIVERYDLETVCLPRFLRLFDDLVAGRPPEPDVTPSESLVMTYAAALTQATTAAREGRWGDVDHLCRLVLAQRPQSAEMLQLLAGRSMASGRAGEAEELMRRVLALHPQHGSGLHALATALDAQGDGERAEVVRRRAASC